jgi:N4-gp56 family major capsid protein
MAYFSLRPELYFDQVADVRATNQAMPGKSVIFTIVNDLQIAPNALSEASDVTPVSFSDSQVTVTLNEYGNSMVTSAKLRGTAFVDIDPVVANVIGYNAGVSLDTIARSVLDSGTQVAYGGGEASRSAVTTSDVITSTDIRKARARLRSQNVPTFGGSYVGFIHPDVVVDLQSESNSNPLLTWRAPHTYSAPNEIWTGDLGQYEGVRWIETPRAPVFTGQGASSANVFGTLIVGRQSLAKAHAMADGNGPLPTIVEGPVTDLLRRYVPLGWYWLGGYSIFRQASVYRLETGSALNSDVGAVTGTYNVTAGSLTGTWSTTPPGLGSLLTAGTATFSAGAGNAVVSSVNPGGSFTFQIGNGGSVTGSGTVTVSAAPQGFATTINPTIDLGETGSPEA